jgi:hypothetical protein
MVQLEPYIAVADSEGMSAILEAKHWNCDHTECEGKKAPGS